MEKILFSAGGMQNDLNATTKIAYDIAEKLNSAGYKCTVIGQNIELDCDATISTLGIDTIQFSVDNFTKKAKTAQEKFQNSDSKHAKSKIYFAMMHPIYAASRWFYHTKYYHTNHAPNSYFKKLAKLLRSTQYKAVICMYMPLQRCKKFYSLKSDNIYVYQVDPWGLNEYESGVSKEHLIRQEIKLLEKAKHIFTTPILLEKYYQLEEYKPFLSKMTAVEFPIVNKIDTKSLPMCPIEYDKDSINILFCGTLDDSFRSPKFFLEAFEKALSVVNNLNLHFLSSSSSEIATAFSIKYPKNVVIHQGVALQQAFAAMYNADVLLNINNTFENQVPSKIFDYFCTGKPIINVQKIDNCPTAIYVKKYPLAFTINENFQVDITALCDFLLCAKERKVQFEDIISLYPDCTKEFISRQILQHIDFNGNMSCKNSE